VRFAALVYRSLPPVDRLVGGQVLGQLRLDPDDHRRSLEVAVEVGGPTALLDEELVLDRERSTPPSPATRRCVSWPSQGPNELIARAAEE
jgi:hypothetical protein